MRMSWMGPRERFEDNYTPTPITDSQGRIKIEYIYSGPWYHWKLEQAALKKRKFCYSILYLIEAAAYFVAGAMKTPKAGTAISEVPALLGLVALALELYGVLNFLLTKEKFTRIRFEDSSRFIGVFALLYAVLLTFAGIANLAFYLCGAKSLNLIFIFLLQILSAAASFSLWYSFRKIGFTSERNTSV